MSLKPQPHPALCEPIKTGQLGKWPSLEIRFKMPRKTGAGTWRALASNGHLWTSLSASPKMKAALNASPGRSMLMSIASDSAWLFAFADQLWPLIELLESAQKQGFGFSEGRA